MSRLEIQSAVFKAGRICHGLLIRSNFSGTSEVAFAEDLLEQTGQLSEIPAWAKNYFDFESYARDLRLGGDYTFVAHQGQVYVYSNF